MSPIFFKLCNSASVNFNLNRLSTAPTKGDMGERIPIFYIRSVTFGCKFQVRLIEHVLKDRLEFRDDFVAVCHVIVLSQTNRLTDPNVPCSLERNCSHPRTIATRPALPEQGARNPDFL